MNTQPSANTLNPLSFPLRGSRLIEASAGTGKTFTIALLYVRLVLGEDLHGNGFKRPLTPAEILVVTFTDLAAGELRDRIRARLVEAADCFRNPQPCQDKLLGALRDNYAPELWSRCAWRLQSAAESMDEASISTIHSWCNRMLVEHAFDTRGLFNRELVTDTGELLTEVVQDYWRVHFYPLDAGQAALISQTLNSPARLEQALRGLLQPGIGGISSRGIAVSASYTDIKQALQQQVEQAHRLAQVCQQTREHWAGHWSEIRDYLLEIRPALNGRSHDSSNTDTFNLLLQEIEAWASRNADEPGKLKSFATGALKFKKNQQPEAPAPALVQQAFDLMHARNLQEQQEPEQDLNALLLAHARGWVREQFDRRMHERVQMSFDDLLVQLHQALEPALGEPARQLADTLRTCFPVAMIDEFQDTDPIQYGIFDRIYQVEENSDNSGLFMIGDPKQSIYSFRGADIHTYLAARTATSGRHYTLGTNYRSTQAVVDACNSFFSYAEQHPQGAFGYREASGDNPIPFLPVKAGGRNDPLWLQGRPASPMTLWYFDNPDDAHGPLARADYYRYAAQAAASQIVHWLAAATDGQTGFGATACEQPLQPADIAILVRTGQEAQVISQALHQRGVASVYLSDRESLFASAEAADLLHWLRACAEPGNEQLVRAALGTLTLNLPLQQLLLWQDDELAWEEQTRQFYRWQHIWQRRGVLVMLHYLLQHYQLPARLLRQARGERSLTNLLHLAEWLQEASTRLDGQQALIRHLGEHLDKNDEQALLRLESDARRIKILTIHKSKGLEFPLVVLPFINAWRDIDGKQNQVDYPLDGRRYREVAGNKKFAEAWAQANRERIREDLRLLYVALTRASHALWLGLAPLKSASNSNKPQLERCAMGHILNAGEPLADADAVSSAIDQLIAGSNILRQPAPAASDEPLPPAAEESLEPARPAHDMGYLRNWWIASYSALQFGARSDGQLPASEPESAREDQLLEISQSQPADPAAGNRSGSGSGTDGFMHAFPRGSNWGTFLHGLLEWAASARGRHPADGRALYGFIAAAEDDDLRNELIRRRCRLRNIEDQAPALSDWLKAFLQQSWPGSGLTLSQLPPGNLAVELEFLLEVHHTHSRKLDRLVSEYTAPQGQVPHAQPASLNGLLKGFIDLVAEHDGRYYVIDWKSNHLGDDDSAYDQNGMQQAIWQHRYDMQYTLYILALHRQLRSRLPDYDYERHMGGALYAFLRGWQNPETRGIFAHCPPRQLIEQLDQLFSRGAQS